LKLGVDLISGSSCKVLKRLAYLYRMDAKS
jgi:hypothetical protein